MMTQRKHDHWLVRSAARNPTATAVVIFVVLVLLPMVGIAGYGLYCFSSYAGDMYDATTAREHADDQVQSWRDKKDRLEAIIYSQEADDQTYDEIRNVSRELDEAIQERRETEAAKPLPDYPSNLCGLIPIAPEEPDDAPKDPSNDSGDSAISFARSRPVPDIGGFSRCGNRASLADGADSRLRDAWRVRPDQSGDVSLESC